MDIGFFFFNVGLSIFFHFFRNFFFLLSFCSPLLCAKNHFLHNNAGIEGWQINHFSVYQYTYLTCVSNSNVIDKCGRVEVAVEKENTQTWSKLSFFRIRLTSYLHSHQEPSNEFELYGQRKREAIGSREKRVKDTNFNKYILENIFGSTEKLS